MKSPIVEFITPDSRKGETEYKEDELFNISISNVLNNSSWKLTDLLICTPVVLNHILNQKSKYAPFDINPRTVIFDEFDEMVKDPTISQNIFQILRKLASQDPKLTPFPPKINEQRQFIFCGSTIPTQFTNTSNKLS
mmetsp:Transcript_18736/g.32027  ORF Transcript_18736/g.32027 Transcript_18736/m.32027 type:complete len:137 (-) Transcript_18736:691-1101(-)